MKGSTYRRCGCKDENGKQLGARCPKLKAKGHATWYYLIEADPGIRGKRRQIRKGGHATQKEAQQALDREKERLSRGGAVGQGRLTVGSYLQEWLDGKGSLRPSTRASYQQHIDAYLVPHLGHLRLSELRAGHIEAMTRKLREKKDDRGPGPATVRRVFATLRNALNKAVRQGLIAVNPCVTVELEGEVEHRPPVTVWTPEEVGRFLDHVQSHRLGALFELAGTTGLRRGEVVGLRWTDVDLDGQVLYVRQSVVDVHGQLHIGAPKTRKSVRAVPLDAGTVATLRAHRKRQAAEQLRWGAAWADADGRVFTQEDGAGLIPPRLTRMFHTLSRQAGVRVTRFHDLRHGAASLALAAGVPLRVVSERLGHSTIGITADLYTKVYDHIGREAADRIAGVIPRGRLSDRG